MSVQEALRLAFQAGLDLVEISPQSDPPVCKILNYGKHKFEQQKKKQEAKKNQKVVEIKEIQLRPTIGEHDLDIKCRAIQRFIEEGNKVKIVLRFRGREMSHQEIGLAILHKIRARFEEVAKIDNEPKLEGRQVFMLLSPAKVS